MVFLDKKSSTLNFPLGTPNILHCSHFTSLPRPAAEKHLHILMLPSPRFVLCGCSGLCLPNSASSLNAIRLLFGQRSFFQLTFGSHIFWGISSLFNRKPWLVKNRQQCSAVLLLYQLFRVSVSLDCQFVRMVCSGWIYCLLTLTWTFFLCPSPGMYFSVTSELIGTFLFHHGVGVTGRQWVDLPEAGAIRQLVQTHEYTQEFSISLNVRVMAPISKVSLKFDNFKSIAIFCTSPVSSWP